MKDKFKKGAIVKLYRSKVKINGQVLECIKRRAAASVMFPSWLYSFDGGTTWGTSHMEAYHRARLGMPGLKLTQSVV